MVPRRKAFPTDGTQQSRGPGVCGPHRQMFAGLWTVAARGPWSDRASCSAVSPALTISFLTHWLCGWGLVTQPL